MDKNIQGITFPKGFHASGVACGIKRKEGAKDLAIVYSENICVAAGVFTKNVVKAAPVLVTTRHLYDNRLQAIVVNSGNANACTGPDGLRDALNMAECTAKALGISPENVGVCSTGVIGVPMPMDRVKQGISMATAALTRCGGTDACEAIMTTDTQRKIVEKVFDIGGTEVRIGGMAKGSGMISPNMATMLAFVTTDAVIDGKTLDKALRYCVDRSFNIITVDGDMSTNDSVIILANGMSGCVEIKDETYDYDVFLLNLLEVLEFLAKEIARDGEGATKLVEVRVKGCATNDEALCIAKAIANSNLVKTAIYGCDANWGRILAAAGYAGVDFDPHLADVYLGNIRTAEKGARVPFDEDKAKHILSQKEVVITVDINQGNAEAKVWTCDLTHDYVTINGSYRS
jgi:glutamate N-acetyltransferase/amino-acid N-acetyltransferase